MGTPEVAAARNAFMETFNEVKMKAAEEMVEVTERRRREADMEDTAVVVDMEDEKMAESPSVPLFAPLAVPHLTQGLQAWAGTPRPSPLSRVWSPGSSALRDFSHLRNSRARTSQQLWSSNKQLLYNFYL